MARRFVSFSNLDRQPGGKRRRSKPHDRDAEHGKAETRASSGRSQGNGMFHSVCARKRDRVCVCVSDLATNIGVFYFCSMATRPCNPVDSAFINPPGALIAFGRAKQLHQYRDNLQKTSEEKVAIEDEVSRVGMIFRVRLKWDSVSLFFSFRRSTETKHSANAAGSAALRCTICLYIGLFVPN